MSNKLIIAAAGSGKTTLLVKKSLAIRDEKILITTYTRENKDEIIKKFFYLNGCIPENITVKTWFSFLIQHGVKPYQSVIYEGDVAGLEFAHEKSGVKYHMKDGKPVYWSESEPQYHYFSKNKRIYSDKVSKFVVKADKLSRGLVFKRIEKIYQHIFIDEVQDMAGYDFEVIKLLFSVDSNILLVGDPRQVTYHTHWETKHKKYINGKIIDFITEKCRKGSVEIDCTTLNKTYRNNKEICTFANSICSNFAPCTYEDRPPTGHDGVFFVSTSDVDKYLSEFNPMQLRDSKRVQVNTDYPVINFGNSKGRTFDRVLIYPTKPILEWLFDHNKGLVPQSQSKFYVAVTRAKHSVAIVVDDEISTLPEGIQKYSTHQQNN